MRILFFGDIVGREGRRVVVERSRELRELYRADLVIANGENSAGGAGITPKCAEALYEGGVDLITTGNHIWQRKEIYPYLNSNRMRILRPLNYPTESPGAGVLTYLTLAGKKLTVVNLAARVFMTDLASCPFEAMDNLLGRSSSDELGTILVDFHGEATSEKGALGRFLDGRVGAVVGTHTHVQTADARVLPKGTAFITDVGMCGAIESIIGVEIEPVVERFRTGLNIKFSSASGRSMINGVLVELEDNRATSIERIWFEEPKTSN